MTEEFTRRLNHFQSALDVLRLPQHLSVWEARPPLAFTAKVAAAEAATARLVALIRQAEQNRMLLFEKADIEEAELEQEACLIGHSLTLWLRDQNDERNAQKLDGSLSQWRRLTGIPLIDAARLVYQIGEVSMRGANSNTLAHYGVTTASLEKLRAETDDYAAALTAPEPSADCRIAQQVCQRSAEVETLFESIDTLIQHFRPVAGGSALIRAWTEARAERCSSHLRFLTDAAVHHKTPSSLVMV